jgi:hypothetical protein
MDAGNGGSGSGASTSSANTQPAASASGVDAATTGGGVACSTMCVAAATEMVGHFDAGAPGSGGAPQPITFLRCSVHGLGRRGALQQQAPQHTPHSARIQQSKQVSEHLDASGVRQAARKETALVSIECCTCAWLLELHDTRRPRRPTATRRPERPHRRTGQEWRSCGLCQRRGSAQRQPAQVGRVWWETWWWRQSAIL